MYLSKSTKASIIAHASATPDVEVCGIVDSSGHVYVMRNTSPTPETHYAWDPKDMVMAYRVMDDKGEHPTAFYHSHPNGKKEPSETDMRGALNEGMVYLIVYPHPPFHAGHATKWWISGWRCTEPGILVHESLDVS